jgi:hypothetical protein
VQISMILWYYETLVGDDSLKGNIDQISEVITSIFVVAVAEILDHLSDITQNFTQVVLEVVSDIVDEFSFVVVPSSDNGLEFVNVGLGTSGAFSGERFDVFEEADGILQGVHPFAVLEGVDQIFDVGDQVIGGLDDAVDQILAGSLETELGRETFEEFNSVFFFFSGGGLVASVIRIRVRIQETGEVNIGKLEQFNIRGGVVKVGVNTDLGQLSEIITSSLVVVLSEVNSESDGRFEGTSDVGGEVLGNGGVEDGSVVLEGIDGRAEEPDEGVNGVFTFRSEGGDFLEELDEFIDGTGDVLGSEVLDEVVNITPGIGSVSVDASDELLSSSLEIEVFREAEEEIFSIGGIVLKAVLGSVGVDEVLDLEAQPSKGGSGEGGGGQAEGNSDDCD